MICWLVVQVSMCWGVTGDDRLEGGSEDDELYGEEGDDQLSGSEGADLLYGDKGKDVLIGGSGKDQILGGTESDWLFGIDSISMLRKAPSTNTRTLSLASCCLRWRHISQQSMRQMLKPWIYTSKCRRAGGNKEIHGKEDISDLIKSSEPINERLDYIVDMRSLLEVAFRSAITPNDEGAEYDGDSTTDWSGITPAQWELLRQLLMILQMSMATKTDYKGNKEMIAPWRTRSGSSGGWSWLRCSARRYRQ